MLPQSQLKQNSHDTVPLRYGKENMKVTSSSSNYLTEPAVSPLDQTELAVSPIYTEGGVNIHS